MGEGRHACWGALLVIHQAPAWELGDPKAFRGHRPLPSELLPSAWPQQVVLGAGLCLGAKVEAREVGGTETSEDAGLVLGYKWERETCASEFRAEFKILKVNLHFWV